VFWEDVQQRPRVCLSHLSFVKVAVSQFYLRPGKQRKVGWVGGRGVMIFYQNLSGEKEVWNGKLSSNSQFFVTKFRGELLVNFHAVIVKGHRNMRNWLLGLPGLILSEKSALYQIKWWACTWVYSPPVSPFSILFDLNFPCMARAFFHELCLITARVSAALFRDLHKFNAVPLLYPSWNHMRPDTQLQIN
jgi:hypothetical protein